MAAFSIVFVVLLSVIIFAIYKQKKAEDEEVYDFQEEQQQIKDQEKPKRQPFSDAQIEAMRQADEAFDWQTHNAIVNGTYTGPLPDYDGAYWSRIIHTYITQRLQELTFAEV